MTSYLGRSGQVLEFTCTLEEPPAFSVDWQAKAHGSFKVSIGAGLFLRSEA